MMRATLIARALSVGILLTTPMLAARAQEPTVVASQQIVSQGDPAYSTLQRMYEFRRGFFSREAGGPDLPATLTREQFGRTTAGLIQFFYCEMSTEQFTRFWKDKPEIFNDLRQLAQQFGPEITASSSLIAPQTVANIARGPFPDVPRNHWAAGAVERLRVGGIVVGAPSGTYNGNSSNGKAQP